MKRQYGTIRTMKCECGCNAEVGRERRFVSGHNLKVLGARTDAHRQGISEGQRRAWQTKRQRLPLGSVNIDVNGYRRVKVVAGAGAWPKEHILIMEKHIGRKLFPGEQVHHVNGKRADNRIENLFLCRDGTHHSVVEASFQRLLAELLAEGVIRFDHSTGTYSRVAT